MQGRGGHGAAGVYPTRPRADDASRGGYPETAVDLRSLATMPAVPRQALSRLAGGVARLPVPRQMRRPLWSFLAKRLGIEADSVPGALEDYPDFLSLFTRPLPEGARPLPAGEEWLSPADGLLVTDDPVTPEGSWLIKGVPYSTEELLCGAETRHVAGYRALQIYLAPRDYHRFHAPCAMAIEAAHQCPGDLQPVDPVLVRRSMRVLVRNRRILLRCRALEDGSPFALLFVGAFNVGGMRFSFDGTLARPPFGAGVRRYDPPLPVGRGEELGAFEFGSTVVLFAPPSRRPSVAVGERTRAREALLTALPHRTHDPAHA